MPPRCLITVVTVASLLAASSLSAQPSGYATRTRFELSLGPDRVHGRLELLEDARITPSMRQAIAESYGMDPCASTPLATALEPLCRRGTRLPLRPALLRLLDASGRVLATRQGERPLGELTVARLYGSSRRTYLFTVDLNAGGGSYSGPLTRLAEPSGHTFGWVMAADSAGAADTLTLVSTLKSGWRAVPSASGRGEDLLQVRCRPDLSAPAASSQPVHFVVTFERYTFDGQQWQRRRRQEPGCWEAEDSTSFPARGRFP